MKKVKLNLRNKIAFNFLGFALALFILTYFIIIPVAQDITKLDKKIKDGRIAMEERYYRGKSLTLYMENLKKIQPKINLLNQIFINKSQELDFITTLEKIANENQITQKINLNFPQNMENQEYDKSVLQLNGKGEFNKLLKYLLDLESLNYYINVNALELASAGGAEKINSNLASSGDQTKPINMSIGADIYWK